MEGVILVLAIPFVIAIGALIEWKNARQHERDRDEMLRIVGGRDWWGRR